MEDTATEFQQALTVAQVPSTESTMMSDYVKEEEEKEKFSSYVPLPDSTEEFQFKPQQSDDDKKNEETPVNFLDSLEDKEDDHNDNTIYYTEDEVHNMSGCFMGIDITRYINFTNFNYLHSKFKKRK